MRRCYTNTDLISSIRTASHWHKPCHGKTNQVAVIRTTWRHLTLTIWRWRWTYDGDADVTTVTWQWRWRHHWTCHDDTRRVNSRTCCCVTDGHWCCRPFTVELLERDDHSDCCRQCVIYVIISHMCDVCDHVRHHTCVISVIISVIMSHSTHVWYLWSGHTSHMCDICDHVTQHTCVISVIMSRSTHVWCVLRSHWVICFLFGKGTSQVCWVDFAPVCWVGIAQVCWVDIQPRCWVGIAQVCWVSKLMRIVFNATVVITYFA